jgi:hypothetical protein
MRTGLILSLILNCILSWSYASSLKLVFSENAIYMPILALTIGTIVFIIFSIVKEVENG